MYKHVLVAVELSDDTDTLIDKASAFAKKFDAEVSLVYIDSAYGEIYTGFFDLTDEEGRHNVGERTINYIDRFIERSEVPIKSALVGSGNIKNKLPELLNQVEADIIICGHHHDFWSHIVSTCRQLIDSSSIDILIHPIVK
ncbi:universal stress protein [Vibrio sp. JC009]|uniref:universal stress protein n=1 Tax=Vibrio sp. JC009 TaxID=2912314 RepID=UPI0023B1872F|nr:universal stress protein [Vibrio sp. JC009]WED23377.1 universal stress protein [Vibrio sp. JC009]